MIFIGFFEVWLGMVAELTRFGDRQFFQVSGLH
jgi:hypothetical protein